MSEGVIIEKVLAVLLVVEPAEQTGRSNGTVRGATAGGSRRVNVHILANL